MVEELIPFMQSSHSVFVFKFLVLTMVTMLPAWSADGPVKLSTLFLNQLLENSSHLLDRDPQTCLTERASIGGEIAAIIHYIEADKIDMVLHSNCQRKAYNIEFCILSFSSTPAEDQASAGFVFLADSANQRIDLASIKCFQTP